MTYFYEEELTEWSRADEQKFGFAAEAVEEKSAATLKKSAKSEKV